MATILIVDDNELGRRFLVHLLGATGHRVLEAADGAEALARVQAERPDLVIADILMPTMDGYEFVRRLRADAAVAGTRVIFSSASYHRPEAHELARACGVEHLLNKPAKPDAILQAVAAVLAEAPPLTPPTPAEAFKQEHLRLVTDRLAHEVRDLEAVNARLTAILDLGQRLARENDRQKLLETFAQGARYILGASYAALGMLDTSGQALSPFLISGLDRASVAGLGAPSPQAGILGQILAAKRFLRLRDIQNDPDAADFLQHHPLVRSFLGVPVATPSQVYGLLCVTGKLGREEFSSVEERVAVTLTAQLAVSYENLLRCEEIQKQAGRLEKEITERKRTEEKFRLAMEYAPNARVMVNSMGCILLVNRETERMFGYTREELLGQEVEILVPERFRARHPEYRNGFFANPVPVSRSMGFGGDLYGRRKDGSEFPVEISLNPIATAEGMLVLAAVVDITQRKEAEDRLQKNAQLLKWLYRRLLNIQETERRHIARELHDEIGQMLTLVSLHLKTALAVADTAGAKHLADGLSVVDRALDRVRDLSLNLRPSVLDALGLSAALEWYAEQQRQHAAFALHLDMRLHQERYPQNVEISCFRIIQEALTNVARHAQAQNVWVELEHKERNLYLTVRDDGVGFDVVATSERGIAGECLGLLNMQERAQVHDGVLTIESQPSRGTTLRARLRVEETRPQGKGETCHETDSPRTSG